MKAVAYFQNLPIDHPESLQDIVLPEPQPGPRDLLVEVRAISASLRSSISGISQDISGYDKTLQSVMQSTGSAAPPLRVESDAAANPIGGLD